MFINITYYIISLNKTDNHVKLWITLNRYYRKKIKKFSRK